MPKVSIGDGADGVIHTLKTTLGEHEQSHVLCVPQGACSWEQGGKPEAFAQPEVLLWQQSHGLGSQENCSLGHSCYKGHKRVPRGMVR